MVCKNGICDVEYKEDVERSVENDVKKSLSKYTIFYIPQGLSEIYACDCDDFNFTTFDIRSYVSKEVIAYPIVIAVNNEADSLDHIMMSSVINIKYNWGLEEYNQKFEEFKKEHAKEISKFENSIESDERTLYG